MLTTLLTCLSIGQVASLLMMMFYPWLEHRTSFLFIASYISNAISLAITFKLIFGVPT